MLANSQRVPVHGVTSALCLSVLAFFLPPAAVSCKMGYCPSMECACAAILCAVGVRARARPHTHIESSMLHLTLASPPLSHPAQPPRPLVHPWLCVCPLCSVVLAAPASLCHHLHLLCARCHCHCPAHLLPAGGAQGGDGVVPEAPSDTPPHSSYSACNPHACFLPNNSQLLHLTRLVHRKTHVMRSPTSGPTGHQPSYSFSPPPLHPSFPPAVRRRPTTATQDSLLLPLLCCALHCIPAPPPHGLKRRC